MPAMAGGSLLAAESLPDLSTVPKDLETPRVIEAPPAPGLRVRQTTPGWEGTAVYHALYLPVNWRPAGRYPLLVEYAGNGNFTNKFGDVSLGIIEGSNLGYGLSGGSNYLWVCLPYVKITNGLKMNNPIWWGDVPETVAYCTNTVRYLCERFGGDSNAVVLCGFSRGSIACNYLGLHDDAIASLWRAFIPYSNYDGVNTNRSYANADRASALARLQRLRGRPQFICQEGTVEATRAWLAGTGVIAPFTFEAIPFRNHSDQWALRDIAARRKVRAWLDQVLMMPPAGLAR